MWLSRVLGPHRPAMVLRKARLTPAKQVCLAPLTSPRPGTVSRLPRQQEPRPQGKERGTETDDEPLRDDSEVNAERLNRRFARLTAARRKAERERDALTQQHQMELAQTRGQLEAVQRLLSGAAPEMPQTPAPPTGPPQAEEFASHEDYVLAAARYGAQQEFQHRDQQMQEQRQQEQQMRFQQDLMTREQAFKAEHPDFDTVVRAAWRARSARSCNRPSCWCRTARPWPMPWRRNQTVQRLNTLPPPLVLVELGAYYPRPRPALSPQRWVLPTATRASPALPAPDAPLRQWGRGTDGFLQG